MNDVTERKLYKFTFKNQSHELMVDYAFGSASPYALESLAEQYKREGNDDFVCHPDWVEQEYSTHEYAIVTPDIAFVHYGLLLIEEVTDKDLCRFIEQQIKSAHEEGRRAGIRNATMI